MISGELYKDEFIEELANFLKVYQVKTILECGCGDGNVLYGLAKRGFKGIGIDESEEMIKLAKESHSHKNIAYRHLNWLDLNKLKEKFDCVMCRGGSLSLVISWGREMGLFDPKSAKKSIERSIGYMVKKVKAGGIIYVDSIRNDEEDSIHIKTKNINVGE